MGPWVIYRLKKTGRLECIDNTNHGSIPEVADYITDNYVYDSFPGEEYIVIETHSFRVVAQYKVEEGVKTLRERKFYP